MVPPIEFPELTPLRSIEKSGEDPILCRLSLQVPMKLTLGIFTFLIALFQTLPVFGQALPDKLADREFWQLVTELSEDSGTFPQQFMSNEDSALFVIPALKSATKPGGTYIGVGSEQNFTYISAIRPHLAFVVDIRRDNLFEHLMYKALFELSDNRADFVSRLFSRKRPVGLDANTHVKALFDAYRAIDPDTAYYEANLRAVFQRLMTDHAFPLTDADRLSVTQALNAFRSAGPYSLKGMGDTTNPTYADLMAATDLEGKLQSYLASEENYRIIRNLEMQNLVVPVVGDFAGDKAIVGIGRYLREHGAIANTFYVSNVERYLFEQGEHGKKFYANAATLPADASSIIVRSVTSDISRRLGIPIPDGPTKWRSFLFSMEDSLKGVNTGQVQGYTQLFQVGRR